MTTTNYEDIRANYKGEINKAIEYLNNKISQNISNAGIIKKNIKNFTFKFLNKFEYIKKKINKQSNYDFKDITVVLCLKNRAKRFNIFYECNKDLFLKYKINLIIVEGKSNNIIDKSIFENNELVRYELVDIKNIWSRSLLLNYGVHHSKSDIVILSDIDFIYPKKFWDNILNIINESIKANIIGLPLYETWNTLGVNKNCVRKKYSPYSACFMVLKETFVKHGGFNTEFIGFGYEDNELLNRLFNNNINFICTSLSHPYGYVLHYSHNNKLRLESKDKNNKNKILMRKYKNIKKIDFKIKI